MPATPADGKGRRPYRSQSRAAQARRTRERIVAAAGEQFAREGYAATTMRSIAAAAGVSTPTVELAFGTKAQLLKAAVDVAIAGDHEPVPMLARDWAARARAETSAAEFLAVVGRTLRPIMTRSAGVVLAAYEAAGSATADEALRAVTRRLGDQRAGTAGWIVDGLRDRAALRAGLTRERAVDELWLLMDPAVYDRLTRHRGWTPAAYERWLVDTALRLLLECPTV